MLDTDINLLNICLAVIGVNVRLGDSREGAEARFLGVVRQWVWLAAPWVRGVGRCRAEPDQEGLVVGFDCFDFLVDDAVIEPPGSPHRSFAGTRDVPGKPDSRFEAQFPGVIKARLNS